MKTAIKGNISILVVDDDNINNFLCTKIIEKTGHAQQVITCTSAEEAIKLLHDYSQDIDSCPDLIFLDINMPIRNGWDFLEDFSEIKKKLQKEVVIVMLSSSIYPNDIEKAARHKDVATFTSKPLTIEKVHEIINTYL